MTRTKSHVPGELERAVKNNDINAVQELIQRGTDIYEEDEIGWDALCMAASCGHTEIANLLIDAGADVNKGHKLGVTPLMNAAAYGYTEMAQLLLDNKAKIDAKDGCGWTALMYSADRNEKQVARLLIENGADITIRSYSGQNAMILAENGQHLEIQLLLRHAPEIQREHAEARRIKALHTAAARKQQSLKAATPKVTLIRRPQS